MAVRGRQALTLAEKIDNAVEADASTATSEFVAWLEEQTGLEVDTRSVILAQKLYPEFLKTPAAAEAREAAKAEREAAKEQAKAAKLTALQKRAAALGLKVQIVSDDDAE